MSHALVEKVREAFPTAVLSAHSHRGDEVIVVARDEVPQVIGWLRNDPQSDCKLLRDIVCVDLLTYASEKTGGGSLSSNEVPAYAMQTRGAVEPRFYVAYNLYSITKKHSIRVRVDVRSDDLKVPTIAPLFRTADWWERYLFDMFGVEVEGHPDPRRILMPEDSEGHPLRKDYPLGYEEPQFTFNYDEINLQKIFAKE